MASKQVGTSKGQALLALIAGEREQEMLANAVDSGNVPVEVVRLKSLADVPDEALKRKPVAIVLEWNFGGPEDLAVCLQKLRANSSTVLIPVFFVLSGGANVQAVTLGSEYGVRGIFFFESLGSSLVTALGTAAIEAAKPSALRSMINKIEVAAARNNVGELDMAALDFYTLFPNEPRAKIEYANLCIRRSDWAKAKELISSVMATEKANLRAINTMVRLLLHERNYQEAAAVLGEVEGISPRNCNRMVLLGDIYRERGMSKEARHKYDEALDIVPDMREAKQGIGLVELSEGDVNEALTLLKETSSQEEIGSFFNDAAILAVRDKRLSDALSLYQSALTALEKNELRAKIFFNTGLAHYKFSETEAAIVQFKKAVETDPGFERARNTLAQLGIVSGLPPAPSVNAETSSTDADEASPDMILPSEERIESQSGPTALEQLKGTISTEDEESWAPWNPGTMGGEPQKAEPKKTPPAKTPPAKKS